MYYDALMYLLILHTLLMHHVCVVYPPLFLVNVLLLLLFLYLSLSFPGSHCTSLHTIELFNCNRVTDEGMIALAAGCSALRSVDLMCCDIQLVTRR